MTKTIKLLLAAFVAVVVVVVAGGAFYVLRDSAEDEASLAAISPGSGSDGTGAVRTLADGSWQVQPGDDVFVGYRVHELLRGLDKEVTGRTPGVTGTMTIAGRTIETAEFTADVTQLTSDDPMRDKAIGTRGIETDTYPEASFVLTEPITLPSDPTVGEQVSVTARGDLTVHGVTKPIELPLEAQWDGDRIRVATAGGGVRIQFQDYGFGALTVPIATTDDFGYLEAQLLFVPA